MREKKKKTGGKKVFNGTSRGSEEKVANTIAEPWGKRGETLCGRSEEE